MSALAASCDEMAAEVLINAQRAQSAIKDEFSNAIATNQGSSGFSASQETAVTQMMAEIQAALSNPNASAASFRGILTHNMSAIAWDFIDVGVHLWDENGMLQADIKCTHECCRPEL